MLNGIHFVYKTTANVSSTALGYIHPVLGLTTQLGFKMGEVWARMTSVWSARVNCANNLYWLYNAR